MRRSWLYAALLLGVGCSSAGAPGGPGSGGDEGGADAGGAREGGGPRADAADPKPRSDAGHGGEASPFDAGGAFDAGTTCSVDGEPGQCMSVSECGALGDHVSTPGYCPGPADIECCARTPSVADNPPIPAGYRLMSQAQVTPAMTSWAVAILDDPTTYPLFATTTRTFGPQLVLARVEWHPPDFNNSAVHRGVTLYVPA